MSREPFFEFVNIAAGAKHYAIVTSEGEMVLLGSNRHGQLGLPKDHDPRAGPPSELEGSPIFYGGRDLWLGEDWMVNDVRCGGGFSIFFRKGAPMYICVGDNQYGQLGAGFKGSEGAAGLIGVRTDADSWSQDADDSRITKRAAGGIADVTCGFNHTLFLMTDNAIFACGSNLWGELGTQCTTSPFHPVEVSYFKERAIHIVQIAAGNTFSLFLSQEGRVFGCGLSKHGQVPINEFEPTPLLILRPGADVQKRIRIKRIACAGDLAVFISHHNEIIVQGSLTGFGFSSPSPRTHFVRQTAVIEASGDGRVPDVVDVRCAASTVVVTYSNGLIAAFGSNTEGQIATRMKGSMNVAPALYTDEVEVVSVPVSRRCRCPK